MSVTVQYKTNSPYSKTPLFDNNFLDILEYKPLPAKADDIYKQITATYHRRPDLMSYDLYGTVDFWYVFMMRNRDLILDPVWDFTEDKFIYIPKIDTILAALG